MLFCIKIFCNHQYSTIASKEQTLVDTSIPVHLNNTMFDYYLLLLKQYEQMKNDKTISCAFLHQNVNSSEASSTSCAMRQCNTVCHQHNKLIVTVWPNEVQLEQCLVTFKKPSLCFHLLCWLGSNCVRQRYAENYIRSPVPEIAAYL